jgi:hypothetical protein
VPIFTWANVDPVDRVSVTGRNTVRLALLVPECRRKCAPIECHSTEPRRERGQVCSPFALACSFLDGKQLVSWRRRETEFFLAATLSTSAIDQGLSLGAMCWRLFCSVFILLDLHRA